MQTRQNKLGLFYVAKAVLQNPFKIKDIYVIFYGLAENYFLNT